jgi:hypothetical protein
VTRIPLVAIGSPPLAHLDENGYLHFGDGTRVEWWVLGDDYWHVPRASASRRQRCVDHTPVVETTIRVPGGDVTWRAAAVATGDGPQLVVECHNAGTIPVALAIARVDANDRVVSLDVVPVTHSITHRRWLTGSSGPAPEIGAVAKGWAALARRGAQITTNDPSIDEPLLAARAALLLHANVLTLEGRRADKAAATHVANALTLLDLEDEAGALRQAAKLRPARKGLPVVGDLVGTGITSDELALLSDPSLAAGTVITTRLLVAREQGASVDCLPGFRSTWQGLSIDVDRLPTNHGLLSFAVRWHGSNPALLWESDSPITASALNPHWGSSEPKGEELVAVR